MWRGRNSQLLEIVGIDGKCGRRGGDVPGAEEVVGNIIRALSYHIATH
jgi:hypothetical protein